MVQGLAFLSKKSWHTKNFANQEKVWLAEERKRAEEQKTKELAKQIQQEKEQDELEAMTGKKTTRRDRGIDWMYEGYNPESQIAQEDAKKQAEEYLMGKEYVPAAGAAAAGPVKGDLNAESTTEGVHAVMAATENNSKPNATENTTNEAAAAPWQEPSVHDRNETFRMRHEDPMFAVAQRAREQEQKYNKKKELYERVVGGVAVDTNEEKYERKKKKKREERRARKRERKEEKRRHRKKHRRDDHYYDYSGDESEESDRGRARHHHPSDSRSRSRSRSLSHDSDRKHHHHRDRKYRRSDRPSRSRSPSYDRHRYRHRSLSWDSRDRRYNSGRHRNEQYDDYGDDRHLRQSEQSYHRSRQTSRSFHDNRKQPSQQQSAYERDCKRAKSPPRQSSPLEETSRKKEGYGLQGGSSKNNSSRGELGPDRELLEQKRQKLEEERRRRRETASSRRHRSGEERAEALRAMERDAQHREESRRSTTRAHENDDDSSIPSGNQGNASFLQDVRKKAHGISGDQSMAERLQQNRNTNQRLNDSFL